MTSATPQSAIEPAGATGITSPSSLPYHPPAPARPRVWTVFVVWLAALVAAISVQVVIAVVIVLIQTAGGKDIQQVAKDVPALMTRPGPFIGALLAAQLAMGAVTLVAARLSPEPVRLRLGWVSPAMPVGGYALLALASVLPLVIGVALAELLATVLPPDPSIRMLYEQMTPAMAPLLVLAIALAPGFVEELLFRGYMQRRLLRRWSPAAAITVVSILFALVHGAPHAILVAAPLGVWLGIIAWRTGSVWPSVLCHAFVNGAWNAWHMGRKFAGFPEAYHPAVVVGAIVVGSACLVLSIRLLRRLSPAAVVEDCIATPLRG